MMLGVACSGRRGYINPTAPKGRYGNKHRMKTKIQPERERSVAKVCELPGNSLDTVGVGGYR